MAAMISGARAREKLSTVSVDNLAEKISGEANFPCFRPGSLICLKFMRLDNALIQKKRFLTNWQIPDKSQEIMTTL
jgi:hypothetical protein